MRGQYITELKTITKVIFALSLGHLKFIGMSKLFFFQLHYFSVRQVDSVLKPVLSNNLFESDPLKGIVFTVLNFTNYECNSVTSTGNEKKLKNR